MKEKAEEKEFDCSHQENVVCPYCGHQEEDSWEFEGGETQVICGNCGLYVRIEQQHSRTFSSFKTCQESDDHQYKEVVPGLFRCGVCRVYKQR